MQIKRKLNKKENQKKFEKICLDIQKVRIQGAENIAIAGLELLKIKNDPVSIKKIISLRPTEPLLRNCLFRAKSFNNLEEGVKNSLDHLKYSKEEIKKHGANLIKNGCTIFTHCHSSSVIDILVEAKKQGKNFIVYNTETRPLFQGRKTSSELAKNGIPVIHVLDSAARLAIKRADIIFFGADAITKNKVYNKIGSELFALTARNYHVPVYIISDSWKFDPQSIYGSETPLEERPSEEIWKNAPKGVIIENPAFEKISTLMIEGIVSELGILPHEKFLMHVLSRYPWIKQAKFN